MMAEAKITTLGTEGASSAAARAKRLKRVRNLANLSRKELCEGSEINLNSLKGWEIGRYGGLSKRGANRIVARLQQAGIVCTAEWLLYDIGPGPSIEGTATQIQPQLPTQAAEQESIVKELLCFKAQNLHSTELLVLDDSMAPEYLAGDYVAGIKRSQERIEELIGYDCIVQLKNGEMLLRNLRVSAQPKCFTLICNNPHTTIASQVLSDVELLYAAPVIWHRRRDPSNQLSSITIERSNHAM